MNVILTNDISTLYFLVSVRKERDEYAVKTKWLSIAGNNLLWERGGVEKFLSLKEAKSRCKIIVKNKISKKGMIEMAEDKVPMSVAVHLAPPIDSQMTPEEFLKFVTKIRMERYVTFKENTHMEESFDIGVQYVGYLTDDPDMLEVYDKHGKLKGVFVTRLENIVKTEDCLQAENSGRKI